VLFGSRGAHNRGDAAITTQPADAAQVTPYTPRVFRAGLGRIPRCCDVHDDWATLAQHLLDDFPTASIREVIRTLYKARTVVDTFGLAPQDALLVAELMTRHRLMVPPTNPQDSRARHRKV
jgi:hypothetical protein